MPQPSILTRHQDKIRGVISCYDRVIIKGTLPQLCYAEGMTAYLYQKNIRIFDYPKFAEPLREEIRENAEKLARENGIEIEFIRKMNFRKEDRIQEIIKKRGDHPGLVHIFSAMELCETYRPWYDKQTGKSFLRSDTGKCLHYYFYVIDKDLGLCFIRVPTWAPFRLQFYFNGHNLLASQLKGRGVKYEQWDNAFADISDFKKAQEIADQIQVAKLHARLDQFARRYCPVTLKLNTHYHWSLSQVEYATDIIFKKKDDLKDLYETLVRTAIHAVKPDQMATFLARKRDNRFEGEMGNHFHTRIEGTRIKHHMGPVAIKMYDKGGFILRIETTTNDVSFFKHHRMVEQRNGEKVFKVAPLKRTIYSLSPDLQEMMQASNRRYLDFISEIEDPTVGIQALRKISAPTWENERSFRGYNLFQDTDQKLFEVILRGEFNISGMRNKNLQQFLGKTTSQISYALKRLRMHGIVRKIKDSYKYYLTEFGRRVALMGLKLKELYIIPTLAGELRT